MDLFRNMIQQCPFNPLIQRNACEPTLEFYEIFTVTGKYLHRLSYPWQTLNDRNFLFSAYDIDALGRDFLTWHGTDNK